MVHKVLHRMKGYVKIQICGYSQERFLNLCRHHDIQLWGLRPKENSYEMYMDLEGFRKIRPIAKKTNTKVKLIEKSGMPFFLYRNKKRKLFFAGIIVAVMLLFGYSNYIWDISFDGNEKWTDTTLMDFLAESNVLPGIKKNSIDCSEIAREIREEYNDIVWVSVSIDGCRLKIKIKENDDTFLEEENKNMQASKENTEITAAEIEEPKDIVAAKDGVITSIITRNGIPLVHEGDEVKAGDILVSGRIEVTNDAKEVIAYQYCQADADIFADTEAMYTNRIERSYMAKDYVKNEERRKWYLLINNYMLSVGTVLNSQKYSDEYYRVEKQMKLGENFYLPLSYGDIRVKSYTEKEKKYTNEEIQEILSEEFSLFLQELEKKGVQIRENSVRIRCYEEYASAEGVLYLNQSIVQTADTEILEIERNEQNESSGIVD